MRVGLFKKFVQIVVCGFLILMLNGCNTLKVKNKVSYNSHNQKLTNIEILWDKSEYLRLSVTVVSSIYTPRRGISLQEREYHLKKFGEVNKILKKNVPLLLQEKLKKQHVKVDTNAPILLSITPTSYSREKITLHTVLHQKSNKKVLWKADLSIPLMHEVLILNIPKEKSQISDSVVELIIESLIDAKYLNNKKD